MSKKVIEAGDREKVVRTWQNIITRENVAKSTEELIIKTVVLLEQHGHLRTKIETMINPHDINAKHYTQRREWSAWDECHREVKKLLDDIT